MFDALESVENLVRYARYSRTLLFKHAKWILSKSEHLEVYQISGWEIFITKDLLLKLGDVLDFTVDELKILEDLSKLSMEVWDANR